MLITKGLLKHPLNLSQKVRGTSIWLFLGKRVGAEGRHWQMCLKSCAKRLWRMSIRKKDFDASDRDLASYYLQKSPDSTESFNFSM